MHKLVKRAMKFGVRVPNSGPLASRENILQVADQAEKLGFHAVWVHDHITWESVYHRAHLSAGSAEALTESQKPNFYESLTTLSFLAGRLKKVKIGVAVIILPLRNPVVLAKQLANMDVLSEGRLFVGVAPGAPQISKPEFDAVGVPYEERGKITDEYISAMRTIWSEELPSFSGRYIKFDKIELFPKPTQKLPPILIGGGERGISARALRRVVELGDGWIPAYLTSEEIADGVNQIKEAAAKKGRDPNNFFVSHEMFTAVNIDSAKARGAAQKSLLTNFSSIEEAEKRSLIGNPSEVAAKLENYSKAGTNMTELKFVYSSVTELLSMMELFAEKVMPQVAG
jgi:probable F420-dependent oxidoreductase